MTVGELKKELDKYDDRLEVMLFASDTDDPVEIVEHIEDNICGLHGVFLVGNDYDYDNRR